jgi:acetoin utilization protein AcuB
MKAAPPLVSRYMTPASHTIEPADSLPSALMLMHTHRIRHLPVTRSGKLVGVLSMRDTSLVTTFAQAPPAAVKVEDVMVREPYVVTPQTPLVEMIRAMAERRIGSAIVIEDERVVGVFTTIDALRTFAEFLESRGGEP